MGSGRRSPGGPQRGLGDCHLPGRAASQGARTRAPAEATAAAARGAGSGGRWRGRGAASRPPGPGRSGGSSGFSRGGWGRSARPQSERPRPTALPPTHTASGTPPRPGSPPPVHPPGTPAQPLAPPRPTHLGRAHAPELLSRGEDRPAQAPPLAVGAAEPVVQVARDVDQACGARRSGLGSPGRPLQSPGGARDLPGTPAHPGRGAPRAAAASPRRCGWGGRGCRRSRRSARRHARRRLGPRGGGCWPGRPPCGCCPGPSRPETPRPRAAPRLRDAGTVAAWGRCPAAPRPRTRPPTTRSPSPS